jgi:hypothetical protein
MKIERTHCILRNSIIEQSTSIHVYTVTEFQENYKISGKKSK